MTRQSVGIVFGGANNEHEVSCSSARSVIGHLDPERFTALLLGIDRAGGWHRLATVDELATAGAGAALPGFEDIDVVLPVLHGRFGEDGTVQGLLEIAGVPYVGNGVLASALAMDKLMCQRVLASDGLPVIETAAVTARTRAGAAERAESFGYPVFVKPNRAGSSVGASRVDSADQLDAALDLALATDVTALIQPVEVAAEIDVGVLQAPDDSLSVGAPLRVRTLGESAFFDYAAKYTPGGVDLEVPAQISDELRGRLGDLAMDAFRSLGCEGLARVDCFVRDDESIRISEVNTMPGMTALSQYPRMWQAEGVGYRELLGRLIERALVARPEGTARM